MIKLLEQGTKQFFIDKFIKSKHLDKVKELKEDKLVLYIADEDEFRTLKQNRTFHSLITELYKSGLSSFSDYNECRDYFKAKGGLITYEKQEVHPLIRNIERQVYKNLTHQDIKDMYSKHINNGQKTIRSVADSTKEELTLMIQEVINYCYEVNLNSEKFQEIMQSLNNE